MALLIGKKIGMTQLFDEAGMVTPVTVIEAGPCPIVQVKTPEKEGYSAIQIGFIDAKESRTTSPQAGHFKRAGVQPQRILREMRVDDVSGYEVGGAIDVKAFEGIEKVHVTGTSKGRGFAGTVKRHHFRIGRRTHGNKSQREPGSVGNCATPSRIFKGKRLPGRMGGVTRTVKNISVVQVDAENNLLFLKGAVPGANNGVVFVRTA
ncbi:MAG: 50S ribosomal protein L3 [Candidatus Latescibacterota bacterium]|jgi:large subunit ribosomal protein L3